MSAEGDDGQNSTKDAIINVILSRKSQLYRQRASVMEANEEAEKVNLVSLSKTQIKLKYPAPPEKTVEQQDQARTSDSRARVTAAKKFPNADPARSANVRDNC